MSLNELSLFSGGGGGLLATKHLLGWRTIGYVEWDEYCQRAIAQRIKDGLLDEAPIFGDIRAFIGEGYAERYRGMVDVITAGFPCQPFSVAGKQRGEQDDRNMWPSTIECIRIIRPRYALLENVPGLLAHEYIRRIYGDLAEAGYDARWCVLGADDCGAPHRRKRLWILADTAQFRCKSNGKLATRKRMGQKEKRTYVIKSSQDVADTESNLWGASRDARPKTFNRGSSEISNPKGPFWWGTDPADNPRWGHQEAGGQDKPIRGEEHRATEPRLGRVAHGVAHRVDRLKAIGNGQVPAVVARVWEMLRGIE